MKKTEARYGVAFLLTCVLAFAGSVLAWGAQDAPAAASADGTQDAPVAVSADGAQDTLASQAEAATASQDQTNAKTVVKVAFCQLDGFFEYDENGNEYGYGVDYLNELSKYADIEWQYVPVDSWEGIKDLMLTGQVDVRMPVSEPSSPSQTYDYTVEPMMTSYHAIMTLNSRNDLYYQDYDTISHLKIAAVDNMLDKTAVGDYLSQMGVIDNLVFYPDYNSCRAALDSGAVDAVISNVMDLTDDMKILDKFDVVDNYITTLKGNPCYTLINNALTRLKLENPSFQADLYERYFPDRANEPFTKEESQFIEQTDHLTVAVYADRKPVSYVDDEGNYHGIAIDLVNLLAEKMGVAVEYVPVTTAVQSEMLDSADLVMPVPSGYDSEKWFTTPSILDLEILMAVPEGTNDVPDGSKVGVLDSTPGIANTMEKLGVFDIVRYADSRSALEAVQRGEVAAVANSSYTLDWMLENPRFSDLTTLRYQSFPLTYNLCGKADDQVLKSVLSKAIRTLSDSERSEIVQRNTKVNVDDFSLIDRLYVYHSQIVVCAIAVVVLIALVVAYSRSRTRYIARIKESIRQQKKANQAKSEFLSRMSHDMRTPLNVIMGMSHLAKNDENPAATTDCLEKIDVSAEFLLGLINDVLDMEHIESGKMTLHPVPYSGQEFSEYIDAVIRPLCEQKSIRFDYACDYDGQDGFVIMQDKLRINQIYFNLLSNAVKFTPEGGLVSFHTKARDTDHNTVVMDVTVSDTGIGMSQEFLEHMFEPFSQESQVLLPISDGTGLGLSIVRRLCDMMGMTVSATSELDKGTTFTLHGEYEKADISTKTPLAEASDQAVAGDEVFKDKTFLVCEDHPLNQEIIRRLLERKGSVAVMADDGKRGVELFERSYPGNFDAVLMDVRMPVMDGLEATRAIRALPRSDARDVPIIALTANAYVEDVEKCLAAGMNAHLSKPLDPDTLYATLKKYL